MSIKIGDMKQDRLLMVLDMLKQNPNDSFLRYALALEYKKIGNSEKAIEALKILLHEDPEYLATYYQLGKLFEEEGKTQEAIAIYRQGKPLALKSNDPKTLGELNEALLLLDAEED